MVPMTRRELLVTTCALAVSLLFPHAPIARRQRVSIRSTDAKRSNTTHGRNQAPSSSIPQNTFFILWREEDMPYAMALALAAKGLVGPAWRGSKASRSGQIGIRPTITCNANPPFDQI